MRLEMNTPLSLLLPRSHNDKFVHSLVEADVAFLVVGGVAIATHGCRDVGNVDDLDLLVEPTVENGKRILVALDAAQEPTCIAPEVFAKPALQIPIKKRYYVELLTPQKGFDFSEMWSRGIYVSVGGLQLKVASVADLIRMKEVAVAESQKVLKKHEADLARLKDA